MFLRPTSARRTQSRACAPLAFVAAAAAALLLAACKMPVHTPESAPPSDPFVPAATQLLDNTAWQLVEWKQADGTLRTLPDGKPVTLDLSAQTGLRVASGFAGCNRFTGSYTLKNGLLSFGPLASTRMACAGAGADIERPYLDALAHIARSGVQMHAPQTLILLLQDGEQLTFRHPPDQASGATGSTRASGPAGAAQPQQ